MASTMLRMVQIAVVLLPAASSPTYIGCNLQVMPTKRGAGRNVMSTTGTIMGAAPTNDGNLVSASVAGSTVTLTFSGAFQRGLAHATIGTFTAPQFAGAPGANAARCTGTQTIIYKDASGTTNSILWNPPAQQGLATSVTFSFAGASGYGTISRHTITLPLSNAPGTTATPTVTLSTSTPAGTSPPPAGTSPVKPGQYKKITSGNCVSNQMDPITDIETCEDAAQILQLASKTATTSSATPLPEGCYYLGNRLYLAVNPANVGKGAAPGYEQICAARPATVPPTTSPTITPSPGAGQTSGSRYAQINVGTCASNQMASINDLSTCAAAAASMGLASAVIQTSAAPTPEGCHYGGNRVLLSTNPANTGNGAAPGFEVICLIPASSLDRFSLVKAGSCVSNKMSAITDRPTCEVAAQVLQLADKTAATTSDAPAPEGCFYNTNNNNNQLYLSVNPANSGYGASPGYELLCLSAASSVASEESIWDNKTVKIGGIAGVAVLLCLILSCCIYKCRTTSSPQKEVPLKKASGKRMPVSSVFMNGTSKYESQKDDPDSDQGVWCDQCGIAIPSNDVAALRADAKSVYCKTCWQTWESSAA